MFKRVGEIEVGDKTGYRNGLVGATVKAVKRHGHLRTYLTFREPDGTVVTKLYSNTWEFWVIPKEVKGA